MDFFDFMKERMPGLFFLKIGSEDCIPGTILKRSNLRPMGTVWQALNADPADYVSSNKSANILYGTLSGSKSFKGSGSVLGILKVSGESSKSYDVDFKVSGVTGRTFVTQSQLTIQPAVNKLKKDNPAVWKIINDQLVVLECYYASSVTAVIKASGKKLAKASVEKIVEGGVGVDYQTEFKEDGSLVISNNSSVPFGVRGYVV